MTIITSIKGTNRNTITTINMPNVASNTTSENADRLVAAETGITSSSSSSSSKSSATSTASSPMCLRSNAVRHDDGTHMHLVIGMTCVDRIHVMFVRREKYAM